MPAGAKGAVVFMDPPPNQQLHLPPFGRAVVELKIFADTFGTYEDNITFNVRFYYCTPYYRSRRQYTAMREQFSILIYEYVQYF